MTLLGALRVLVKVLIAFSALLTHNGRVSLLQCNMLVTVRDDDTPLLVSIERD